MTYSRFSFRNLHLIAVFLFLGLLLISCGPDKPSLVKGPDHDAIVSYLKGLDYNPAELLEVRDLDGNNSRRKLERTINDFNKPVKGKVNECKDQVYSLEKNFDETIILRPTNGVVWPGALVYANKEMLNGTPQPITLKRGPLSLRLDLPGIGKQGNIYLDEPDNLTVQSSIDETLEWWNANSYQEGYKNSSLSSYESTVSYSSEQLSLDVGVDAKWATGSAASQLDYTSTSEKSVAVMLYKQVFYTVVTNTPPTLASVFAPETSLSVVQEAITAEQTAAYISSVSYGRIIMFRLETSEETKGLDLSAVLTYAGGVDGSVKAKSEYDELLQKSTITVITIGGDAEVASEAVKANTIGSLHHILTGRNAVYSRSNPGLPIGYTIRFLKDNTIAKMGFDGTYTISECKTYDFDHEDILVKNKYKQRNIRAKLSYVDSSGTRIVSKWKTIKDETFEGKYLDPIPVGAYDVRVNFEKFVAFDGWTQVTEKKLGHVDASDKKCFVAYRYKGDEYLRACEDAHKGYK